MSRAQVHADNEMTSGGVAAPTTPPRSNQPPAGKGQGSKAQPSPQPVATARPHPQPAQPAAPVVVQHPQPGREQRPAPTQLAQPVQPVQVKSEAGEQPLNPVQAVAQAESRYAHYTRLAEQAKREGELSAELARLADDERRLRDEIKARRQREQELLKHCNQAAATAEQLSREGPTDDELAVPELQAQLASLTRQASQPRPRADPPRDLEVELPAALPPQLRSTQPGVQPQPAPQPEPRLPRRLSEIVAAQEAGVKEVRLHPHDRKLLGLDIRLTIALIIILLGGGTWIGVSAMQESSPPATPATIYYSTPQAANLVTRIVAQATQPPVATTATQEAAMPTSTIRPTEAAATRPSNPTEQPAAPLATSVLEAATPTSSDPQSIEAERLANSLPASNTPTPNPVHDPAARVVQLQIPRLGIDTPVQTVGIVRSQVKVAGQWQLETAPDGRPVLKWDVPKSAAGLQTPDVGCGEAGNIVLNGHSGGRGYVFDALKDPTAVPPDTTITCDSAGGQQHRYVIYKAAVFDPRDTSFEQLPTGEERHLVLYTCQFGKLDRRVVYFARLEVQG